MRLIFIPEVAENNVTIRPLASPSVDRLVWNASKYGVFSVKSAYWLLGKKRFGGECSLAKMIWGSKIHA